MNPWIRTSRGHRFHLLRPHANEMDIRDVASHLSKLCRFCGATTSFYSVAQHSCLVSDILPKPLKLCGLLHDATEAWYNDISTQCKSLLPTYKEMEERAEKVAARKWHLPFPFPAAVKMADLTLLATEFRDLMNGASWSQLPHQPTEGRIVPWSCEKAEREFLKRFRRLTR